MFLLCFILCLVIFFSIVQQFSSVISNRLSRHLYKITDDELNLRSQVKDLKSEQEKYNVTDEFAKYFKLQRQIDKALDGVKDKVKIRSQKTSVLTLGVKIASHVLHAVCMLSLILLYRREPLLTLPSEWFTPLGRMIAFPTGVPGGVGVTFWILACNTVVQKGRRLIGEL